MSSEGLTTETLCGLLAEPERLRVFAAIALGADEAGQVAEQAGVSIAGLGKALRRLRDGGLVSGDDTALTAHPELFKQAMRRASAERPPVVMHHDPDRNTLLTSVFRNGRIRVMPEAPAKVRIVLEHIVTRFEPGVRYTEPHVNHILKDFYDDHVTLRRYLVDAGLMAREDGRYWRTG